MSVADYTVFGEIVTGSKILVAEYPSKPGGCGIWYKLPNGNKQTAFPKAELEAFFRSQNLDIGRLDARTLGRRGADARTRARPRTWVLYKPQRRLFII